MEIVVTDFPCVNKRSVTHDFLRYINILTYLLKTVLISISKVTVTLVLWMVD